MRAFRDKLRDNFGVESICKVLRIAPSSYRRYAAQQQALSCPALCQSPA
jgi:putative transposase